jgi:LPS sulfotransferase NodH
MKPLNCYFICATARTGSYLLCEAMRLTGIAGRPEEFFWKESGEFLYEGDSPVISPFERSDASVASEFRHWGVSTFPEFLAKVFAEGTTPNGVFGAKVFMAKGSHRQLVEYLRQSARTDGEHLSTRALLEASFPGLHHIFITRRNKLRQAVSLWRANETGLWGLVEERSEQEEPCSFDCRKIDHYLQEIVLQEAAWQDYFHEIGVSPCVVVYEDFVRDYEPTIRRCLKSLGLTPGASLDFSGRKLRRQSDHFSEEWLSRYQLLKVAQRDWMSSLDNSRVTVTSRD